MSLHPYAKLLVNLYEFPKNETDTIAHLLTKEDEAIVEAAIATLADKPSGDRMKIIIYRYFGINCERMTLRAIGGSFDRHISGARVRTLLLNAQQHLRKVSSLRPLIERINCAEIQGCLTHHILNLPSPEQANAFQSAEHNQSVSGFTGHFLLDCFPTCIPHNPCPTCQARELLQRRGILDEVNALAQQWQSRPSMDWRNLAIIQANLSVRTVHCLQNDNVWTLGQLCIKSEAELLRIPNFGRKSLDEVKQLLVSIGKQLRS